MTDEPVKTGENRKPGTFTKGDSRINRKGRPRVPKSVVELNKLIDEIAAEEVVNPTTGEQVMRLKALLRSLMTGRDSHGKIHILDRRYGKVPASLELTGKDGGGLKVIVEYVDETHQTPETTRGTAADQSDPQEA